MSELLLSISSWPNLSGERADKNVMQSWRRMPVAAPYPCHHAATSVHAMRSVFMLFGLAFAGYVATAYGGTTSRRFSEEHVLKIAELGKGQFSPDGRQLAIEEVRPLEQAATYDDSLRFVQGNTVLRIFEIGSQEISEVTVPGAFGVAAGPWSPDSKKLLVYGFSQSDAANRGVSLGVWDTEMRSYRPLPGTPAYVSSFYGVTAAWLNDEDVVFSALAPVHLSREDVNGGSKRGAMQLAEKWRLTWKGREPSYGVLESGSPLIAAERETGYLLRVNLESGRAEILAVGDYNGFLFPPDKSFLIAEKNGPAFVALADSYSPQPGDDHLFHSLVRIDLRDGNPPVALSTNLNVRSHLVDWVTLSPSGKRLAFYATDIGQPPGEARLYVYDRAAERLEAFRKGSLEASSVHWLQDEPIILTSSGLWKLSSDREPLQIGPALKLPIAGIREHNGRLFAISDGSVWELNAGGGARRLATVPRRSLAGFADSQPLAGAPWLLLRAGENRGSAPIHFDLERQALKALPTPPAGGKLVDVSAGATHLLYEIEDSDGKRFALTETATGRQRNLLAVNQWRSGVDFAGRHMITYSLPGQESKPPLIGQVLTPRDYQPGKRYPVVVNVYGGTIYEPPPPDTVPAPLPYGLFYNDQILAAAGYVVLRPSLPIDRDQMPLDIPQQLTAGVLAAVDKLIEKGIADPDRLAIMGHSFGGYTTLAVVTKTKRFKAAIASAGVYNVTSVYSSFAPSIRAEPYVHANNFNPAPWVEMMQPGLGVPPWEDPGLYVRNSPLFSADRITTPVLFLHGDLDSWSIAQSEEMFNALYRQGKRARFARFWGEQHGLFSPANIRQAWVEIKRWLDETLAVN